VRQKISPLRSFFAIFSAIAQALGNHSSTGRSVSKIKFYHVTRYVDFNKRHVQFLTSAPNFRRVSSPLPVNGPSRAPAITRRNLTATAFTVLLKKSRGFCFAAPCSFVVSCVFQSTVADGDAVCVSAARYGLISVHDWWNDCMFCATQTIMRTWCEWVEIWTGKPHPGEIPPSRLLGEASLPQLLKFIGAPCSLLFTVVPVKFTERWTLSKSPVPPYPKVFKLKHVFFEAPENLGPLGCSLLSLVLDIKC